MSFPSSNKLSLSKACFVHKKKSSKKSAAPTKLTVSNPSAIKYKDIWTHLHKEAKALEKECHQETLSKIANFVESSRHSSHTDIPTASLILGVNQSDHDSICDQLQENLKQVTPHVVVLQAKDASTITNLIFNTIHGFIKDDIVLNKRNYTFEELSEWYSEKSKSLVLILQDLEAFNAAILQSFILICSEYRTRLPLVLVLGIATTMSTVHQLLSQKVTNCLQIESFYFSNPSDHLTSFFHQVLMNPSIPFKLGPQTFHLIVDMYLFHDFSLTHFLIFLKFCLVDHFYTNSWARLCCFQEHLDSNVSSLSSKDVSDIFLLPSMSQYKKDPDNLNANKNLIVKLLTELHQYHFKFDQCLKMLHALFINLPGTPMGKLLREVYILALEQPIIESPQFKGCMTLLGLMSREEISKLLDNTLKLFTDDVKEVLRDHLATPVEKEEEAETKVDFSAITLRSQIQEKLKEAHEKKMAKSTGPWKLKLLDILKNLFKDMVPPSTLPLYEVLYWNDFGRLKRHLLPAPRATLHKMLLNPQFSLNCDCCQLKEYNDVSSALPALPLAYKLHLESGKMINLYDWLQAFISIKSSHKMKLNLKSKEANILHAQFVQAVSELQFLGYIKATKRKADHVVRLTWGTC